MTLLRKTALALAITAIAAPAMAGGIPFNFTTLTFPTDSAETTRACSDLNTASQCEGATR